MSTDLSPRSFVPDIDCDFNFFDHIEDLLDSPKQNVFIGGRRHKFPSVCNDSPFSCFDPECISDVATEISFPYEDDVHMEWLSAPVEDSFADGNLFRTTKVPKAEVITPTQFHSSSPISVLESSSSSSSNMISNGGEIMPISVDKNASNGYGRARSKRPRPPSFNPEPAMQLILPAHTSHASPRAFTAGRKKIKTHSAGISNYETNSEITILGVRKCLHCEITKTPQWRTGPMGPKTLCNACGVRHKSGRLFPEYRPAASPTFVPSLHSNSHKKVIEMRTSSFNISSTSTLHDPIA